MIKIYGRHFCNTWKRYWNSEKGLLPCSPDWEQAGSPGCHAPLCEWLQVTLYTSSYKDVCRLSAHPLDMELVWIRTSLEESKDFLLWLSLLGHTWGILPAAPGGQCRRLHLACMVLEYSLIRMFSLRRYLLSCQWVDGSLDSSGRKSKRCHFDPSQGYYPQTSPQATLAKAGFPLETFYQRNDMIGFLF